MKTRPCMWCGELFTSRKTGGKPQRFCSERCRKEFHHACRVWAEQLVRGGELPVSALKHAQSQHIRCSEPHSRPDATGDTG